MLRGIVTFRAVFWAVWHYSGLFVGVACGRCDVARAGLVGFGLELRSARRGHFSDDPRPRLRDSVPAHVRLQSRASARWNGVLWGARIGVYSCGAVAFRAEERRRLHSGWRAPAAANFASSAASHLLHKLESDPHDACLAHAKRVGGDIRDVYDSALGVRPSVDDRNDDGAAVVEIADSHARSKRQRDMRGDQAGVIGIAIIGRIAELIGQDAR